MDLTQIKQVWSYNLDEELFEFEALLEEYPILSVDTEFPGFLLNTPREAPEAQRLEDLKFNVDSLTLIQLGIALSDDYGDVCGVWEFNFKNFDQEKDPCDASSISFLKSNGLNLEQINREGIDMDVFTTKFEKTLSGKNLRWVTFHGLYDLAYIFKLLTKRPIPRPAFDFSALLGYTFGRVYDLKFMAQFCNGLLGGELGLERLGRILRIERLGSPHQAGSDCLLTASIYGKMKTNYQLEEGMCEGFLYGMSERIIPSYRPKKIVLNSKSSHCQSLVICGISYSPYIVYYAYACSRLMSKRAKGICLGKKQANSFVFI